MLIILAACLLFIPIRYEARGNIESGTYDVKLHWLLRIAQFCLHSSDGSIDYCIRLFGKRTRFLDKDFLESRKEKRAAKKRKKRAKQARKKEREKQKFRKKRDKKKIQLDTELSNDGMRSGNNAETGECTGQSTDSTRKSSQDPATQADTGAVHSEKPEENTVSEEEAFAKPKKVWRTLTKVLTLLNEYHPAALGRGFRSFCIISGHVAYRRIWYSALQIHL